MKHKAVPLENTPFPKMSSIRNGMQLGPLDDTLPHVAMLSLLNIDNIRKKQRAEGNFDCFGRAMSGYCDQSGCCYYAECLNICVALRNLE